MSRIVTLSFIKIKYYSLLCKSKSLSLSENQLDAQLLFRPMDGFGEGLPGNIESVCRLGDAALLGDGYKVF